VGRGTILYAYSDACGSFTAIEIFIDPDPGELNDDDLSCQSNVRISRVGIIRLVEDTSKRRYGGNKA